MNEKHDRKLFKFGLKDKQFSLDSKQVIFNYSNRTLSDAETEALANGQQFAFQPQKLNYCRFFLPFEKLFNDIKKEPIYKDAGDSINRVKTSIKQSVFKSFYNYQPARDNINKDIIETLKNLNTDPNIV